MFTDWYVFAWAAAVMVAELLPVPHERLDGVQPELPAGAVRGAAVPDADRCGHRVPRLGGCARVPRRGPPLKAVFVRSQIALCVIAESAIFNHTVTRNVHAALGDVLQGPPWKLILPTLLAAHRRVRPQHVPRRHAITTSSTTPPHPRDDPEDARGRLRRVRPVVHGARAVRRARCDLGPQPGRVRDPGVRRAAQRSRGRCSSGPTRSRRRRTSSPRSRPRTNTKPCTTPSPGCPTGCCSS